MTLLTLIRANPITFPTRDYQAFHHSSKLYLRLMDDFGVAFKPKDHFLVHLSRRTQRMGSPSLYSNWTDESINRLLRDVARGAHSLVHETRILAEFSLAYANEPKRRRIA